jgi:hypothetical protein
MVYMSVVKTQKGLAVLIFCNANYLTGKGRAERVD